MRIRLSHGSYAVRSLVVGKSQSSDSREVAVLARLSQGNCTEIAKQPCYSQELQGCAQMPGDVCALILRSS